MLNNISASMIQFYLKIVLDVANTKGDSKSISIYLAIFPLISFTSAVIGSSAMGHVYKLIGRKKTFTVGVIL